MCPRMCCVFPFTAVPVPDAFPLSFQPIPFFNILSEGRTLAFRDHTYFTPVPAPFVPAQPPPILSSPARYTATPSQEEEEQMGLNVINRNNY